MKKARCTLFFLLFFPVFLSIAHNAHAQAGEAPPMFVTPTKTQAYADGEDTVQVDISLFQYRCKLLPEQSISASNPDYNLSFNPDTCFRFFAGTYDIEPYLNDGKVTVHYSVVGNADITPASGVRPEGGHASFTVSSKVPGSAVIEMKATSSDGYTKVSAPVTIQFREKEKTPPQENKFNDVDTNHENYSAIEYVRTEGYVKGYDDGTFRPEKTINRVEFTKIIIESRFKEDDIEKCIEKNPNAIKGFSDIPKTQWFAPYVCMAKVNKIITGYPDGTFKPGQDIAFTEAAKMIVTAFGYQYKTDPTWYKPFVERLEEMTAIPVSINELAQKITRGEMAEIIYRLKAVVKSKPSRTYDELSTLAAGMIAFPIEEKFVSVVFPQEFKVRLGKNFIVEHLSKPAEYPLMVRFEAEIIHAGDAIPVKIYLKPKDSVELKDLQALFKVSETLTASASFGSGEIATTMHESKNVGTLMTKQSISAKRFIAPWGSVASNDIVAYRILLGDHSRVFDEALVEFVNVWPQEAIPDTLSNSFVAALLRKNDARTVRYGLLDTMMKNIEFKLP